MGAESGGRNPPLQGGAGNLPAPPQRSRESTRLYNNNYNNNNKHHKDEFSSQPPPGWGLALGRESRRGGAHQVHCWAWTRGCAVGYWGVLAELYWALYCMCCRDCAL